MRSTSVSKKSPGIFLHAIAYENLKKKSFIRFADLKIFSVIIFITLFSLLIIYVIIRENIFFKVIALTFFVFILVSISIYLFRNNYFISPLSIVLPVIFQFVSFLITDFTIQSREKLFIKKMFEHYVSAELLKEILKNPKIVKLGGEKRTVTVLFLDIESFTEISEKLRAEDVVSMLNDVFGELTQVIMEEEGYIDKYEGDAIMAFWNAPIASRTHFSLAVRAGLRCLKKLRNEINENLKNKGFRPLNIRVGINTGEAVVGNVGSRKRFDYTVIGDTVNLSSRLESINKIYGTNIIVSESTYENVTNNNPEDFLFRKLDVVKVRGRGKSVKIYEVIGFKNEVDENMKSLVKEYEKGFAYYLKGDFEIALKVFENLKNFDRPSETMYQRLSYLIKKPPEKWDGVFVMKEK